MKELLELCGRLDLPAEVTAAVCARAADCPHSAEALYERLSSQAGEQALREALDDPDGFQMLMYMLLSSLKTRESYRQRGIPDQVFYETMACFPRFLGEHRRQFGAYGFDRSWWTWRQVGLRLFRLGELEFELAELNGEPAISVHIPSTAKLDSTSCRASYQQAAVFMERYGSAYADVPYFCNSWLLSPALADLLPPSSRILTFQRDYDLRETCLEDENFLMWVYWRTDLSPEQLPEDTSLQRNLKAHLLRGGNVGSALGVLKQEAFDLSV